MLALDAMNAGVSVCVCIIKATILILCHHLQLFHQVANYLCVVV